jgi:hypothetical protein
MKTRFLSFILLLFAAHFAHAQGEWTQALQSNSDDLEGGTATRICPDNGTVSIGYYRNEAIFGTHTLPGGFLHQNVVFVVKHGATGEVEWTRSITNTDPDDWVIGRGLDVDSQGNIIVGGHGIDTILVDGVYASHDSGPDGREAMFIIKFSPTGEVLWSVDNESTAFGSELMSLTVDPSDNIWFCGPVSSNVSRAFKLDGTNGEEMVETGNIPGQVREIECDADGNVYLRGQSIDSFTINGVTCTANNVMGGNTTNWTARFNTNAIAQWFHVPDQGLQGFSPWSHANQATTADGRTYVEAYSDLRINGDTISAGAHLRGIYLLDQSGTPVWWTRLNRGGSLEIQDMRADPAGGCWITGKCAGVIDLIDTVVTHTGFFAFHVGENGSILQRVFGPQVEDAYSVDVKNGMAVFGGEYAFDINFGDHALTDNLRGAFVARYEYPTSVGISENPTQNGISAYPNPAQIEVRLVGAPDGPLTVRVLNSLGQELRVWERFNAQSDVLDLSGLPTGPLFLRIGERSMEGVIRLIHVP